MKIEQQQWTQEKQWSYFSEPIEDLNAELVFAFGSREAVSNPARMDELKHKYPNARILMNSTSGEIIGETVSDDSISLTAIEFERSRFSIHSKHIDNHKCSFQAGKELAGSLEKEGLKSILIISDGQHVNGTELIKGIHEAIDTSLIPVTGGLAGDADRFEKTVVGLDQVPGEGNIVAIGLYGEHLKIGHGSKGGWDPFGPERLITKSVGNVLYELDGQSALDLYKKYLGDRAKDLPGAALLFPLSVSAPNLDEPLVRTILSIDEEEKSMTFAGAIPQGANARLMKANFDRLVDGALTAANNSFTSIGHEPELAILISCVGRKLVLGQRTEEEVEGVSDILGKKAAITGFYSYGEISPFMPNTKCNLHNQTMTITTLSEA